MYPNSKHGFQNPLRVYCIERKGLLRKVIYRYYSSFKRTFKKIRVGKLKYKDRIELQSRVNNLGSAWNIMKTIMGLREGEQSRLELTACTRPQQVYA